MSAPAVASLSCPQCGAAIELRTLDQAQSVVCSSCGSILDARDPNLSLIQAFQAKHKFEPQIPLGTRGTLKGEKWEVVGYQVRSITVAFAARQKLASWAKRTPFVAHCTAKNPFSRA